MPRLDRADDLPPAAVADRPLHRDRVALDRHRGMAEAEDLVGEPGRGELQGAEQPGDRREAADNLPPAEPLRTPRPQAPPCPAGPDRRARILIRATSLALLIPSRARSMRLARTKQSTARGTSEAQRSRPNGTGRPTMPDCCSRLCGESGGCSQGGWPVGPLAAPSDRRCRARHAQASQRPSNSGSNRIWL
jgi:hypothetical protein